MEIFNTVMATVGTILIGAGAMSGVAWWLFRTFSEKWLNTKFEERLADYKHQQQQELERLRYAINAQMDRTTKLHQWEFETVPEAWSRLTKAHGTIQAVVSRFQSTPDLDSMSDAQREEFLVNGVIGSKMADWQRQKIRDAQSKTDEFRDQAAPFRMAQARRANKKFYKYFRANGIFFSEPIRKRFAELDSLLFAALEERVMNFQQGTREFKSIDRLSKEGEKLMEELQAEVQKRLWGSSE